MSSKDKEEMLILNAARSQALLDARKESQSNIEKRPVIIDKETMHRTSSLSSSRSEHREAIEPLELRREKERELFERVQRTYAEAEAEAEFPILEKRKRATPLLRSNYGNFNQHQYERFNQEPATINNQNSRTGFFAFSTALSIVFFLIGLKLGKPAAVTVPV
jgi:hypothetical protein